MVSQNLLFGMFAFHNDLIDHQQWKEAFTTWAAEPSRSLETILVGKGFLQIADCETLKQQVAAHETKLRDSGLIETDLPQMASEKGTVKTEAIENRTDSQPEGWFSDATTPPNSSSASAVRRRSETAAESNDMDRFRIIKEHAKGGLGIVYLAEDQQFGREVALKQIRDDRADKEIYRHKFRLEAEVTGQLEHPSIVPIYSLGTNAEGRPFYSMRFIRGETLAQAIADYHRKFNQNGVRFVSPALRQLLRRFIEVCNAIEYAHERGILHRDLKPENIMLGKHGETLVVDWGLAKPLGSKSTETELTQTDGTSKPLFTPRGRSSDFETQYGTYMGTLGYASPEQLKGELDRLSPSSDVYSLGAILFHLLTGEPPIKSKKDIAEVLLEINSLQHYDLRGKNSQVPRELAFICHKALSPIPEGRYATAGLLKDDVQRWLDDQSIDGMPEPITARVGRWVRNHQAISLASAVGLLTSFALLSVLFVNSQRSLATEKRLVREKETANSELAMKNGELILSAANFARSRGQFLVAAERMREFGLDELTPTQKLSYVRDLYYAQDIQSARQQLQELDRNLLTPKEQAEFDLLSGDMILLTTNPRKGLKLIQQAIDSQQLSLADQAYAAALTAATAEESILQLESCLKINPFDTNALSRRGISCLIVGRTQEAIQDADLGQRLFPDDHRFLVLEGLIHASRGDQTLVSNVLDRLQGIANFKSETELIRLIGKVRGSLENLETGFDASTNGSWIKLADVFGILNEVSQIVFSKLGTTEDTASPNPIPKAAWTERLSKSLPGAADALRIATGMLPSGPRLIQLQEQMPQHQVANFLAGYSYFSDSKFRDAYQSFVRAAQSDALIEGLHHRSAWFALSCLIVEATVEKKEIDSAELTEVVSHIEKSSKKSGKYLTAPYPTNNAFRMLMKVRCYTAAAALAEQELKLADEKSKPIWERNLKFALETFKSTLTTFENFQKEYPLESDK